MVQSDVPACLEKVSEDAGDASAPELAPAEPTTPSQPPAPPAISQQLSDIATRVQVRWPDNHYLRDELRRLATLTAALATKVGQ